MKGLGRRLEALENAMPDTRVRVDLDALSVAALERLESIVIRIDEGAQRLDSRDLSIAELTDEDLGFLASIGVSREEV